MFKNYFKAGVRNLGKNKLYSFINILGLTTGLTACLLIGIYIMQELSYDKFNTDVNRIVRVTMEYSNAGTVNNTATTGTKVGPQFKRIFPSVEEYVRTYISHNVVKNGEKMFDEPRILYADPAFFKVFSFHMIAGDALTALDAPDKMVISRSMALKYFGTEQAVSKTITCGGHDFRISAVCEDAPQNSQIRFDFVTQFLNLGKNVNEETWWTANWITYLLLRSERDIPVLQKQITSYMRTASVRTEARLEGSDYLTYHLEPLSRVHLYSSLEGFEPNGNITYVYLFSVIALLILLIACANYTNLATAQSSGRSGEIGIRKVMGATRAQVFMQFMSEASFVTCIAGLLALLLSILLLPYFNDLTGKQFTSGTLLQPALLLSLVFFSLIVSFLAGLYPAIILSGTKIISVLKKGFNFTGGNTVLRKLLIVIQFAVSVFLIIYTIIVLQQMSYVRSMNLGYDKTHVLVLPIGGNMLQDFQNLKEGLERVQGVEGVTASYETPEFVQWGDGITTTDENGKHDVSLNAMPVDLDFVKTMRMKVVAGRDFQQSDFSLMDTSGDYMNFRQPYLINETLAKIIGWTPEEAVGKTISKGAEGPVVGVVKDFNFSSLHDPIGPMVIFLGRGYCRNFMLRVDGGDISATLSRLQSFWKERIPARPFTYHFLDDDYNKLYQAEQRASRLFTLASGLAIVLACMGLFGLAAFTTVQRTKEIGIRRVLGAGIATITLLIARNFLQLVGISIVIALPVAWWAGERWLQDFAYRITEPVIIFILTALLTVLIVLCTVGYHSIRVALMNPVKSLRSE